MDPKKDPITGWLFKEQSETRLVEPVLKSATGVTRKRNSFQVFENRRIEWSGDDKKNKRVFHDCKHTRTGSVGEGASTFHVLQHPSRKPYPGGDEYATCTSVPALAPLWGSSSAALDFNGRPDPPEMPAPGRLDWDKARDQFFQDVDGRLPVDISIPLNVLEFRQLRNMVPGFARSIRNLTNWCKYGPYRKVKIRISRWDRSAPWRKINFYRSGYYEDRVSLESLRWGLKDLSSSYLGSVFGVRPLIDDVTNWLLKYYQIYAKAQWHKCIADGKPHRISAATPAVVTANDVPYGARIVANSGGQGFPWNCIPGGRLPGRVVSSTTIRGSLGAWVSIEPKSPMHMVSATIASVLGLNAPLSTVWDVIPFSFVADWFLPVGETIKRVDNRLFGSFASRTARYRIHQQWHTIWTEEFRGVELDEYDLTGLYLANNWVVDDGRFERARWGRYVRTYERYRGWPNINPFPPRKGWSMFASITSGALVLQRLLR